MESIAFHFFARRNPRNDHLWLPDVTTTCLDATSSTSPNREREASHHVHVFDRDGKAFTANITNVATERDFNRVDIGGFVRMRPRPTSING